MKALAAGPTKGQVDLNTMALVVMHMTVLEDLLMMEQEVRVTLVSVGHAIQVWVEEIVVLQFANKLLIFRF